MSLLSNTQGTPERVWSALRIVAAEGGQMDRDALWGWLSPAYKVNGGTPARPKDGDRQTVGAATSLGLLIGEGSSYRLDTPVMETYEAYADVVHDRLCQMPEGDPDYLMLEAFAWLGLVADAQGTEWAGFGDFADKVEAALGDPSITERRFNPTKQTPWRRWMCFLGLGVELPVRASFHPCVTQRLDIELARSDLPVGVALPVRDVLRTIGERMPYLDSGALRASVAVTRGLSLDSNRVSRLLSTGLRDLHDEGRLELSSHGDAIGYVDLAPQVHKVQSVLTITLKAGDND